jgi:hypothetical protein
MVFIVGIAILAYKFAGEEAWSDNHTNAVTTVEVPRRAVPRGRIVISVPSGRSENGGLEMLRDSSGTPFSFGDYTSCRAFRDGHLRSGGLPDLSGALCQASSGGEGYYY